ncbi:MAG: hypothetical protein HY000_25840 [Planctomycetes bacterium]|nr:hypothetical protein [Planctomycetota bacterium]
MTESTKAPLFAVSNHHALGANQPPSIDGDEPSTYHSYFENMHGDQSLFVYRRDTGEALVYSGDADWAAYPVVNGRAQGLVLSPDEQIWLQACLRAIGAAR